MECALLRSSACLASRLVCDAAPAAVVMLVLVSRRDTSYTCAEPGASQYCHATYMYMYATTI